MHMAGGFCASTYAVPAASARYEIRACLGSFVEFDLILILILVSCLKQMAWGTEPLSSFSVGAVDSQILIRIPESRISPNRTQLAGQGSTLGRLNFTKAGTKRTRFQFSAAF
jgi:hypothetical protein